MASRFWQSCVRRYSPLPATPDEKPVSQPGLVDILKSKRVRLVGAAVLFGLVLSYIFFANEGETFPAGPPTLTPSSPTSIASATAQHAPPPPPPPSPAAPEPQLQLLKPLSSSAETALSALSTPPLKLQSQAPQSSSTPEPSPSESSDETEWSRFAYTQYVTNSQYLCNSLMIFESLHRLGSKADRLMMYPSHMSKDGLNLDGHLLRKAEEDYKVKLQPITVQRHSGSDTTWAESYTKLLAFNQTAYHRVLSLDSDSTLLAPMDELFLLPPAPVAMPRAYWMTKNKPGFLSSQLILIEPSPAQFARVHAAIISAKSGDFDMEIMNNLFGNSAMVLPHRPYNLITGEFRGEDHTVYLGSIHGEEGEEVWDPEKVLREAKFLHFSDWPVPKPWIASRKQIEQKMPKCRQGKGGEEGEDCRDRDAWVGFYEDFQKRSNEICDI